LVFKYPTVDFLSNPKCFTNTKEAGLVFHPMEVQISELRLETYFTETGTFNRLTWIKQHYKIETSSMGFTNTYQLRLCTKN